MESERPPRDSRRRQLVAGALIIPGVGLLAVVLWLGRAMPGIFGEWFGIVAGVVSTPFLMEASFVVVGLMIVLAINAWRHRREGDEFVDLGEIDRTGPPGESAGPGPSDRPE